LPRQTVLVLQPAAPILRPTRGELLPQIVDLGLRLAAHKERDRLGERELRAPVQHHEFLPLDLEGPAQDLPRRSWRSFGHSVDAQDLRVLEDGHVELHRLFGLVVEPQERRDLLHVLPRFFLRCLQARLYTLTGIFIQEYICLLQATLIAFSAPNRRLYVEFF